MKQGSLPRKLRLLRAERGLTLAQAASGIGITRESLSLLERGKRRMRTPTLHKIAEFYGAPVEELVDLFYEEYPEELGTSKEKAPTPAPAPPKPTEATTEAKRAVLEGLQSEGVLRFYMVLPGSSTPIASDISIAGAPDDWVELFSKELSGVRLAEGDRVELTLRIRATLPGGEEWRPSSDVSLQAVAEENIEVPVLLAS